MSPSIAQNIVTLELEELVPSPLNPRRFSETQLTDEELRSLGESLRSSGQWELVTVRPHPTQADRYEMANGERRWRAAKLVGLPSLEARVQEMTDAQMLDMMLATGGEGEPLSPLALAHGYAERMALEQLTASQLAERLGADLTWILRHLALLELPAEAARAVDDGRLSMMVGYVIATVPGESDKAAFAKEVLHPVTQEDALSKRAALALRDAKYCRTLQGAPFDVNDNDLVPEAGACMVCPWRAGNNPEVYGDLVKAEQHRCMRPACYVEKVAAARARIVVKFEADGVVPLTAEENDAAYPVRGSGLNPTVHLVEWSKPVPDYLLKNEVAAAGAPKWQDICGGDKAEVVVRLGFDQQNRPVRLVKVAEAITSADVNERAIFNEETRVRYGLANQRSEVGGRRSDVGSKPSKPTKPVSRKGAEHGGRTTEDGDLEQADPKDPRVVALEAELRLLADWTGWLCGELWEQMTPKMRIEARGVLHRLGAKLPSFAEPTEGKPGDASDQPEGEPANEHEESLEYWRARVEATFTASGLHSAEGRDRLARFCCQGVTWDNVRTVAGCKKIFDLLTREKAKVPAPVVEEEE